MKLRARCLTYLTLSYSLLTIGAMAYAQKSTLSPAKVKQIKSTNKSFSNCRKEALLQLKQGGISERKFALMLQTCQENFPGASLYTDCKKQAIKSAKSRNIAPDRAVAECRRFLIAASFDPEEPAPFFIDQGQLYFAGIGLNRTVPTANLQPPNFSCGMLETVSRSPKDAQYLLFGNHPQSFAGLADLNGSQLLRRLGIASPRPRNDTTSFGRIYGDPSRSSSVAFFPSGSCDFEGHLGEIFSGLSAYYLIDAAGSSVTPYFGIAYYKPKQKAITTRRLTQSLLRELGSEFRSFNKNSIVNFITAGKIAETDAEQDPKNLCMKPRQHRFVAVVQARKDDPNQPEYAILANIKNLCEFGDRLGKRLVQ